MKSQLGGGHFSRLSTSWMSYKGTDRSFCVNELSFVDDGDGDGDDDEKEGARGVLCCVMCVVLRRKG